MTVFILAKLQFAMIFLIKRKVCMTVIKHKYFEHPDFVIRHLEWTAFQCILFNKNWNSLTEAIPEYDQRPF